jgi:hypothetical protein
MLSREELEASLTACRASIPGDLAGPQGVRYDIGGDLVTRGGVKNHLGGGQVILNSGVLSSGAGGVTITGSAVGPGATVSSAPLPRGVPATAPARQPSGWDVGVITVRSEETRAVAAALGAAGPCTRSTRPGGLQFLEARPGAAAGATVVATQATDRGQRAAGFSRRRPGR